MQSYTDREKEHKPREGTETYFFFVFLFDNRSEKEHKPREGTETAFK